MHAEIKPFYLAEGCADLLSLRSIRFRAGKPDFEETLPCPFPVNCGRLGLHPASPASLSGAVSQVLRRDMRKALPALILLSLCVSASFGVAQTQCTMDDDEEYAVLAAILFPGRPDIPDGMKDDLERKAYLESVTVRLNGFHGNDYTIKDETISSQENKVPPKGSDLFMVKSIIEKTFGRAR